MLTQVQSYMTLGKSGSEPMRLKFEWREAGDSSIVCRNATKTMNLEVSWAGVGVRIHILGL